MISEFHKKVKGYYIFILILIIWQVICNMKIYNEYILPPPMKVFNTFIDMIENGSIYKNIFVSLR